MYVETTDYARLSPAQRDRVARTLQLAEELGAKTVTLPGHAVAETTLQYARAHNVTKIIVGKPPRSRWEDWLRGSVVDQLIRASGPIDVYVISGEAKMPPLAAETRAWLPHRPWRRYPQSILLVALATLIGQPVSLFLSPTNLVMLYVVAVVIAAVFLGRGPSLLASFLSVLAFDFFFVPPRLTFAVSDTQYVLTFIGLFLVGLVISSLAARAREQAEAARNREAQTAELYGLSRDLAAALGLDDIARILIRHMLRTPLVSITGALSSLDEDGTRLDEAARHSLIENARDEAERLNRLVGNLLDMTRLEAGAFRVAHELCDVQDVIGAALEQLDDRLGDRRIETDVPTDLPLAPMDFVLITRVLVNLLDNSCAKCGAWATNRKPTCCG